MQSTCRSSLVIEPAVEKSGFELKGILLLLICGVYAIFLFLTAALVRWAWSYVSTPVSFMKGEMSSSESIKHKKYTMQPRKEVNHG